MSDKTRLAEVSDQLEVLRQIEYRVRDLREPLLDLHRPLAARVHKASLRKRKWLYVRTNTWRRAGIKYGAKLRVVSVGRKWVWLAWRGKEYAFPASQVATAEPSEAGINNLVGRFIDGGLY
jgi:hypothetical protein